MKRKMYHVVTAEEIARNQAYEDAEEYDKVKLWHDALKIYPTDASVEMSITCQKTATAMRKFIKAYNQAANDGVIPQIMIEKIGDEIPTNDVETWEEMYGSIETDDVHEFVATARDVANYAHNGVYWRHERFEDSHYIFINIDTKFEEHRAEWLKKNSIMQEVAETDGSEDDDDEETTLTEDYNVDDEDEEDELVDEEEETQVEEKVMATAELEEQLAKVEATINISLNEIDISRTLIKKAQEWIMSALGLIADAENEILREGLFIAEEETILSKNLEEKARLETEIAERKMVESFDYIIMTADAFNASIQAAEMAAVFEPVTFEISRFGEDDTVETDSVAVIDTAVTKFRLSTKILKLRKSVS